jgi:hypothetical protein
MGRLQLRVLAMKKRILLAFLAGCSLLSTPGALGDPLTGNVRESRTRVARPSPFGSGSESQKPLGASITDDSFKLNATQQDGVPLAASQTEFQSASPLRGSSTTSQQQPLNGNVDTTRATTGGTAGTATVAPIVDDYSGKGPLSGSVTFRFCYYDLGDGVECCWEGLRDAIYLKGRGVDIAIMLDRGGVRLANKHNGHELQLHRGSTERMIKTHALLRQFIDAGGTVYVSERWARTFGLVGGSYSSLSEGVKTASDEEMADLLVERSGRIVEY